MPLRLVVMTEAELLVHCTTPGDVAFTSWCLVEVHSHSPGHLGWWPWLLKSSDRPVESLGVYCWERLMMYASRAVVEDSIAGVGQSSLCVIMG